MEYAQPTNSYRGDHAAGTIQSAKPQPPRTISSAIGRMDDLTGRLSDACKQLSAISDSIGGPRPTNCTEAKDFPPSGDVVGRLNDSADRAHEYLTEIESLLGSIARSLG